jgi:iron-sulfur cluster assembly protein
VAREEAVSEVPVTVTEAAAVRIREVLAENGWVGGGYGLRFGLQDGGCSGYTYLLDFEEAPSEDDLVVESNGVRVFIHPLHLPLVEGSVLDWKIERFEEGFDVQNPHAKRFCGCGESFDV